MVNTRTSTFRPSLVVLVERVMPRTELAIDGLSQISFPYISQPLINWHTSKWAPKVISTSEGHTSKRMFAYSPSLLNWVGGIEEKERIWVYTCLGFTTTLTYIIARVVVDSQHIKWRLIVKIKKVDFSVWIPCLVHVWLKFIVWCTCHIK